ncbi:MAG TPA: hypothetical protein DCR04_09345 [Flavobacteriales bacterium]|nr:hypothetical protein [Flavobacteriales bacterium]
MRQDGISVIICCYNSAKRIEPTLRHLAAQEVDSAINWEIILVDNNSSDNTSEEAKRISKELGLDSRFKLVQEPEPGLSSARHRGYSEAKYQIALMVDDDNSLSKNYLNTVVDTFKSDCSVGMVGGLGIPVTENNPPTWFNKYAYCFATGDQSESENAELLYGAGLALKLDVLDLLKKHGFQSLLTDRIGNSLISGGDTELCLAYRMAGYRLKYLRNISFEHHLPKERINWKYLQRLFFGFGMSKARIDLYTSALGGRPKPAEGTLPLWLDRLIYLLGGTLRNLPLILGARLFQFEGNDKLLEATAKLGHIKGLLDSRTDYKKMVSHVYKLKNDVQHGR